MGRALARLQANTMDGIGQNEPKERTPQCHGLRLPSKVSSYYGPRLHDILSWSRSFARPMQMTL